MFEGTSIQVQNTESDRISINIQVPSHLAIQLLDSIKSIFTNHSNSTLTNPSPSPFAPFSSSVPLSAPKSETSTNSGFQFLSQKVDQSASSPSPFAPFGFSVPLFAPKAETSTNSDGSQRSESATTPFGVFNGSQRSESATTLFGGFGGSQRSRSATTPFGGFGGSGKRPFRTFTTPFGGFDGSQKSPFGTFIIPFGAFKMFPTFHTRDLFVSDAVPFSAPCFPKKLLSDELNCRI